MFQETQFVFNPSSQYTSVFVLHSKNHVRAKVTENKAIDQELDGHVGTAMPAKNFSAVTKWGFSSDMSDLSVDQLLLFQL